MINLKNLYEEAENESNKRFDNFNVEEIGSIKRISEDAYLENPTWLGGDQEFVGIYIDLNKSSKLSFKKQPKTMAKIYDYFTQNAVDFLSIDRLSADYIDIKGDGVFGIFEGENASLKALASVVTFKTFFERKIKPNLTNKLHINVSNTNITLGCKISINKDKLLVKKIGKRGNNNEVWAGRLINNASKMANLSKEIIANDADFKGSAIYPIVVSDSVYKDFKLKEPYVMTSCGHDINGNATQKVSLWREYDTSMKNEIYGDRVWYVNAVWCLHCGNNYLEAILS